MHIQSIAQVYEAMIVGAGDYNQLWKTLIEKTNDVDEDDDVTGKVCLLLYQSKI